MKDRIPKYAGRVKLTPVANQPNVYDMVRADEPFEEGTPLKKATLLSDETATLLGLTGDSNVNDAFGAISRDKVSKTDIIDNLTTIEKSKPLSANQGNVLNDLVGKNKNSIDVINNKFDNGILKIENGGTGSNLGIVKTYIGQYEGTGTTRLDLVLPYKPKAILIMGGDISTGATKMFEVIEFSKIAPSTESLMSQFPVTRYVREVGGTVMYNDTCFDEANNTLTIAGTNDVLAFNNTITHTYIMLG